MYQTPSNIADCDRHLHVVVGPFGDGTCDATCALRDALAMASDGDIITFAAIIQKQTADTIGTVRISMTALNASRWARV